MIAGGAYRSAAIRHLKRTGGRGGRKDMGWRAEVMVKEQRRLGEEARCRDIMGGVRKGVSSHTKEQASAS